MVDRIAPLVSEATGRVQDLIDRILAVRIVQSSIVLAAQAFLALFPLLIIAYAVIPSGAASGLSHELRSRVGINGESSAIVARLVGGNGVDSGLSGISVLLVIVSAIAFARALQRVYQYAWDLPVLGLRGLWRTIAWLIGVACYFGVVGVVVHLIHNGEISTVVTAFLGLAFWWWTQFLLLGGRVRWRALFPGAILTAVAQLIAALVSLVVVPRQIRSNEASYGPIGVVFALESWFVVVAGVIVATAAIGATVALSKGRVGAWARGTRDPDGWRRRSLGP